MILGTDTLQYINECLLYTGYIGLKYNHIENLQNGISNSEGRQQIASLKWAKAYSIELNSTVVYFRLLTFYNSYK